VGLNIHKLGMAAALVGLQDALLAAEAEAEKAVEAARKAEAAEKERKVAVAVLKSRNSLKKNRKKKSMMIRLIFIMM